MEHPAHPVQSIMKMFMVMQLNVSIIESGVMKCFVLGNASTKIMVVSVVHVRNIMKATELSVGTHVFIVTLSTVLLVVPKLTTVVYVTHVHLDLKVMELTV